MKARIGIRQVLPSLHACDEMYQNYEAKSRTYVAGVKAVRIRARRMGTCTLYPDGTGGYKIRYYHTDILHYTQDGYVGLYMGHFATVTTFARVWACAGIGLNSSRTISMSKLRIWMNEETREGKGASWMRRTIPFVEGIRVHLVTGEIHPDDIPKIPNDLRELRKVPTKAATKAFKPLWDGIAGRIMMGVKFKVWSASIYADRNIIKNITSPIQKLYRLLAAPEEITDELLCHAVSVGLFNRWNRTQEQIQHNLERSVLELRRALLEQYARDTDGMENVGGEVIGNGYYVSKEDMK